ncbi:MAG: hypothetical protein M4579_002063 [Chaenotheca gracillima]|nr:MAG: hypothetical protein M4579_002063 [Chaenotheca gracillima]
MHFTWHSYVELLEQQQAQLVAGIQESYRRLRSGEGWTGSSLKERSEDGRPSVHDILERLDVLGQSWDRSSNPSPTTSRFEEDPFKMQQSLIANGAPPMVRHSSISSDSDHSPPSPASYHNDPICSPRDSFNKENDRRYQPTTPAPSQESHLAFYSNQPTTHMLKSYQRSMPHANAPSTMDPALLQRQQQQQQQQQQQTHHVWPNAPLSTSDFNSVLNGHPFYNTGPSMSYYPTHQDSFSTHSSNRPSLSRNDPCLTTGALPVLDEEMWGQEGYFDNREIVA